MPEVFIDSLKGYCLLILSVFDDTSWLKGANVDLLSIAPLLTGFDFLFSSSTLMPNDLAAFSRVPGGKLILGTYYRSPPV